MPQFPGFISRDWVFPSTVTLTDVGITFTYEHSNNRNDERVVPFRNVKGIEAVEKITQREGTAFCVEVESGNGTSYSSGGGWACADRGVTENIRTEVVRAYDAWRLKFPNSSVW